jgi:4-hydroxybenzoate polyprenyltransferase
MKQLNLFIELTRLKKPIGFMLLFWPCTWGLTITYNFKSDISTYFKYILLFLAGSILMRSAGCIINDIVDKNLDKKVERTKHRPLASNKISIQMAFTYACILCILAFLILINFNNLTIILALGSMPLAFTYPLMKRITYWPQLFLGITFNYGLILGWTSIAEQITIVPLVMYFGAIFWTLGYDTIYGFQDIKDDEIIGVKSTSIKFKKNPKLFLKLCYLIFIASFFMIGIIMKFNILYFLVLCFAVAHLFFYQIKKLNINSEYNCLNIFKSNNILGLIIYISLLTGKIFT